MVLGLGTTVITLNYARATRPNTVPSRSLSRSRHCRPHPPAHKQARHCRSDHMSQPRNGTCSRTQPAGELTSTMHPGEISLIFFESPLASFFLCLGLSVAMNDVERMANGCTINCPQNRFDTTNIQCPRVTCCLGLARSAHPTQLRLGNTCE